MNDNAPGKRIGLLLVPGFSHLAMAAAIEPLFIANWVAGRKLFKWSTLSTDGLSVKASNGTQTPVDFPLGTDERFDIVLVVASFDARRAAEDPRLLKWLRWAERTGSEVGAIETGSEILAAAGMLRDHSAAVHWYNVEGMRERYPNVDVTDTLYSLSGRHVISAGGSATLDMMTALIARTVGQSIANEVAQHLLLVNRAGTERQSKFYSPAPGGSAEDVVGRAREIMVSTIDEPMSCTRIADMVGVSERHLQRLFQQQFGSSMLHIYQGIRMERAHQLVQLTDLSITEISVACGFSSLEAFSRSYRGVFGVAPSRDRSQSVESSVFRLGPPQRNRREGGSA